MYSTCRLLHKILLQAVRARVNLVGVSSKYYFLELYFEFHRGSRRSFMLEQPFSSLYLGISMYSTCRLVSCTKYYNSRCVRGNYSMWESAADMIWSYILSYILRSVGVSRCFMLEPSWNGQASPHIWEAQQCMRLAEDYTA
jgi:hypothetical protein